MPTDFEAAGRVQQEPGLDQVICSVHNLSIAAGRLDFTTSLIRTPPPSYAHLDDYFHTMLQSVQWGKFDTFGHIPTPCAICATGTARA